MDNLISKALRCQKTSRPPIWFMRQAGRYLPEYLALKEKYSFLELCRNPELATKVTLMPFERYSFDAAILFADILLILETLGFDLRFGQDHGPLIDTKDLLDQPFELQVQSVKEKLYYIPKTIQQLKKELTVPLLGFCGAPFTLTTYIFEGRTSKDFKVTRSWMQTRFNEMHHLLKLLTEQTIEYLLMQIHAGVDAVQIFDSWAGHFSFAEWNTFSYPYLRQIVDALCPTKVPVILFAKGSSALYEELASLKPQVISLDSSSDLLKMAKRIPSDIALQGNLDPHLLFAPLNQIEQEVKRLIQGMQNRKGYIFNLGHGLLPQTPLDAVHCVLDTLHSFEPQPC